MTQSQYKSAMKKLTILYLVAYFVPASIALFAVLFLTDALAKSSTWPRENVFLCMLPAMLWPFPLALVFLEWIDKKVGIKCECGQSLSFGKQAKNLLEKGGCCPQCGKQVIEPDSGIEAKS